jgi:hypothetical protein
MLANTSSYSFATESSLLQSAAKHFTDAPVFFLIFPPVFVAFPGSRPTIATFHADCCKPFGNCTADSSSSADHNGAFIF